MNYNCNLKDIPRITRGNDFTLLIELKENVLVGHEQVQENVIDGELVINTSNIKVTNSLGQEMSASLYYTASVNTTDKTVSLTFNETLPKGSYGVEIKGTIDGADFRWFAPPKKCFYIVESTHEAYVPPERIMTYHVTANTGLGVNADLSSFVTNLELSNALGGKVDKVNGKGLSTNDFTDEYKDALDDIMENGSAFSTGEKVGEVGITDEATQNSEDLITSGAVYSMMNAISSGAGVSAYASPSVIFKNTATNVSVSATMKNNLLASSIQIKDGNTIEHSGTNTNSISKSISLNLSADKTYNIVAVYQGMTFNASVKVSARHPIYVGMGTSASAVAVSANRLTARTSAAGTYTKSATANGQHFYILVPTSDFSTLNNFSMGGAPFAMTSTTQTINGISYKVYESGAIYNSGTQVNVTAS